MIWNYHDIILANVTFPNSRLTQQHPSVHWTCNLFPLIPLRWQSIMRKKRWACISCIPLCHTLTTKGEDELHLDEELEELRARRMATASEQEHATDSMVRGGGLKIYETKKPKSTLLADNTVGDNEYIWSLSFQILLQSHNILGYLTNCTTAAWYTNPMVSGRGMMWPFRSL